MRGLLRPSGLPPVHLHDGEHLVWQGGPSWRRIVLDVFHLRAIVFYFALILVANGLAARAQHLSRAATLHATLPLVGALLGVLLVVLVIAHANWRCIHYTVTTDRVVLRYGVALAGTLSIPHRAIAMVSVRMRPGHAGDIPLQLRTGHAVSLLKTWPLVRPWRFARAECAAGGLGGDHAGPQRDGRNATRDGSGRSRGLGCAYSPNKGLSPWERVG